MKENKPRKHDHVDRHFYAPYLKLNGFTYALEWPPMEDPPDAPFIEREGQRYVMEYPKRILIGDESADPLRFMFQDKRPVAKESLSKERVAAVLAPSRPPSYRKLEKMIGLETVKESMREVIDMVAMQEAKRCM